MPIWMLKSEPTTYAYDDLERDGGANGFVRWDGIRNYTARNHLRAMAVGDACFIYHSGEDKHVVGLATVVRPAYPDPTAVGPDEVRQGWVCVDIAPAGRLPRTVTLAELKAHSLLREMTFVRQSRLSVSPVTPAEDAALRALAEHPPTTPTRSPRTTKPAKNPAAAERKGTTKRASSKAAPKKAAPKKAAPKKAAPKRAAPKNAARRRTGGR